MYGLVRGRSPIRALWLPALILLLVLTPGALAGPAPDSIRPAASGHHEDETTPPRAAPLMWWRQDLHAPRVVGDTIYGSICTDGGSCLLAAVDRVSGADRWIVPTQGQVVGVTPTIVVARHDDRLFGLTVATRKEAWSVPLGDSGGNPTVWGDNLFVARSHGIITALDPETGGTRWRATIAGIPTGGRIDELAANESALLLTISEAAYESVPSSLIALSPRDGAELWRTTDDTGGHMRIHALDNDVAYVTGRAGWTLTAFSVRDGAVRWSITGEIGAGFVSAAVSESAVIVSRGRGQSEDDGEGMASISALSRETGAETWRFEVDADFPAAGAAHDGVVYVTGGDSVYALDEASGTELWSRPVGSGQVLTAVAGMVLVEGSALYALQVD